VACIVVPVVGAAQLIPVGLDTTVPPAVVTARAEFTVRVALVGCAAVAPKVAVTVRAALIVTVHVVAVPVQAPLQPVKVLPLAAAAVSVTAVPEVKLRAQVVWVCPATVGVAQVSPAGAELTEPEAVEVPLAALMVRPKLAVAGAKFAVTLRVAVMARVQVVAVPVQAPLQPVKAEPVAGVAVSVTFVPLLKLAEQLAAETPAAVGVGQLMPAGFDATVPAPAVMPRLEVTVRVRGASMKVAVTLRAALIVTVQVPVPVHAPLQPVKDEPAAGVAVSVTAALKAKLAEQVAFAVPAVVGVLQVRPAGEEATEPEAVVAPRSVVTDSACCVGLKVAVTERTWLMATVQVEAVPVQAPPQPAKVEPAGAEAVSVTEAPLAKAASQLAPQLMPAGFELTEPCAALGPALDTWRAKVVPPEPRNPTLRRRRPVTTPLARVSLTAMALTRSCTSASGTLRVGCACLSRAKAPATWGAAIEVPSMAA
jgi:hypothetical protein